MTYSLDIPIQILDQNFRLYNLLKWFVDSEMFFYNRCRKTTQYTIVDKNMSYSFEILIQNLYENFGPYNLIFKMVCRQRNVFYNHC